MAGLPIGGNVDNVLYRLEVHYNNPNKTQGNVLQSEISMMKSEVFDQDNTLFSLHRSS